jgi:hypothetical protein
MADTRDPALPTIGYRVTEFGDGKSIGEVEGIGWYCLRVHKVRDAPGRVVYVPARAIDCIDPAAAAVVLAAGIAVDEMLAAPVPSTSAGGDWHRRPEWWADLLAHYGYWVPGPGWTSGRVGVEAADSGVDRFRHARRAIAGGS